MKHLMKTVAGNCRQAVVVSVVLMLLCGLAYPLAMTGISAVIFPNQATGSLVQMDGKTIGSALVGQEFTQDYYLWGRPSAYHYNTYTTDGQGNQVYSDGTPFTGLGSGSDNMAPTNPELKQRVQQDMQAFLEKNPGVQPQQIPTDLLTSSGSGLDPHISVQAAQIQVPRIAKASGLSEQQVQEIIQNHTTGKLAGIFGEETVNVLLVNLDITKAMES